MIRIGMIFEAQRITEPTNVYGRMYRLSDSHNYVLTDDCIDIVEIREEKLKGLLNDN